jgi:hypothetical protein
LPKIVGGIWHSAANHLVRTEMVSAPKHKTNRHMKTLIKAGAMLALIAGLGLATVSAAESCKACKGCAKSCSSCVKCSDGKCASCCK